MYDNAAKMKSFHATVQYMYAHCIPFNAKEALKLDEKIVMIIGRKQ